MTDGCPGPETVLPFTIVYATPRKQRRDPVVTYSYQPKFPKTKLREIVVKYIGVMETLGKAANCSVAFVGSDGTAGEARVRGWLLSDTRPETPASRYVILPDGDTWREVASPQQADLPEGARVWLNGPDDDLVTLLARSQANARMGGNGFLDDEAALELGAYQVTDRREQQQPYQGPERRGSR
jgi:hypothetical protein